MINMKDCYKCQNLYFTEGEECCFIYGDPNHGISDCKDWTPFKSKKRLEN